MKSEVFNFLNSIRVFDLQLLRLQSQRRALETCLLPSGIRYDKDKVMSSPEDQLSKICGEINEIEVKMADIAYKKARRIVEVEKVISKLSEEEYKTVLTLCYIDHMAIGEIADRLGYSSDWVYKKRRKATDELERYI